MRHLVLVLTLPLAGCFLRPTKQAATPPAPQPTVVQPSAPEPQLSVAQTEVQLPSPQPFNPASIPKTPAPPTQAAEQTEQPAPTRPSRRAPVSVSKPEPEADAPAPTPAGPVEEQPAFRPILSADEQKRLQNEVQTHRQAVEDVLKRAAGKLSTEDQGVVTRIHTLLNQCEEASKRGDYALAYSLSDHALILARGLRFE